jgi:hypothetical protein
LLFFNDRFAFKTDKVHDLPPTTTPNSQSRFSFSKHGPKLMA